MQFSGFIRRWLISFFIVWFSVSIANGGDQETAPNRKEPAPKNSFTIGLIPEHNIFRQKERYQPLAEYLRLTTGLTITLKILPRYGNITQNFMEAELDGAFLGSFTFALIHRQLRVEALVRPEKANGTSTYHGLVFVRKDSGITDGAGMKGKRFAFVDKATTAGYLLPLSYFKRQGIDDYNSWFKESYFTGTHEDAIYDVLNKKADAGAAKNTVYCRLAKEDPRIVKELQVLTESPPMPENGLAVRHDLDPVLKKQLKETLLGMHKSGKGKLVLAQFGAAKFIETQDGDYQAVYQLAREVGIP